jgi:hypothetical protein
VGPTGASWAYLYVALARRWIRLDPEGSADRGMTAKHMCERTQNVNNPQPAPMRPGRGEARWQAYGGGGQVLMGLMMTSGTIGVMVDIVDIEDSHVDENTYWSKSSTTEYRSKPPVVR